MWLPPSCRRAGSASATAGARGRREPAPRVASSPTTASSMRKRTCAEPERGGTSLRTRTAAHAGSSGRRREPGENPAHPAAAPSAARPSRPADPPRYGRYSAGGTAWSWPLAAAVSRALHHHRLIVPTSAPRSDRPSVRPASEAEPVVRLMSLRTARRRSSDRPPAENTAARGPRSRCSGNAGAARRGRQAWRGRHRVFPVCRPHEARAVERERVLVLLAHEHRVIAPATTRTAETRRLLDQLAQPVVPHLAVRRWMQSRTYIVADARA